MKYRMMIATLVLTIVSATAFAQGSKLRMAHIGLIYPLSTNGFDARQYTNAFSMHAIAGVSRSELSFCAAGVSNIIYDRGTGVIAAGFSNHILNRASGLQAAGFMNTVQHSSKGLQAAGFLNYTGSMKGMQAAGFCNIAVYNVKGMQAAGFCNLATGDVKGFQTAGFFNMADTVDAQVAGFMNIADDANTQISGFINMSDAVNTQVSGFVNIAGKVKGTQLGVINIADSNDYPIGIINIVKNGNKAIGTTIDENGTLMASFRSGGRVLYGVLGTGINLKDKLGLYALEAGMGMHIRVARRFNINVEGVSETLTNFYLEGTYFRSSLRVMPALRVTKQLEIFAGPAITHVVTDRYHEVDLPSNSLWSHTGFTTFNALYIGGLAGVQLRF